MAYKEDVNSRVIITIAILCGFLVIVLMIGVQAWFMYEAQNEVDQKYSTAVNFALADLRSQQQKNISSYRWVDRDQQIVAIPIQEAMTLLIRNNGRLPATQPTTGPAPAARTPN